METTEPQNLSIDEVADLIGSQREQSDTETEAEAEPAPETTEPDDAEAQLDEPEADEADDIDDVETDAEAGAEAEDEVEPAQFHTVKVDGKEQQVSYDELLRGYAGQAYVQKGMSENAAKTRELEAQVQALNSERQAVLQAFEAMQSGAIMQPPQPPSQELSVEDPIAWVQENARYQGEMAQWQAQQQQFQQITAQQQQQQAQELEAEKQRQAERLVEFIPELRDAEKAPQIKADLAQTAEHYGFSASDLDGVMDARAFGILNDAMKWRKLQQSKPEAQRKTESARPVVKPGPRKSQGGSKARKVDGARAKMKRTGSVDDVAAFIGANRG